MSIESNRLNRNRARRARYKENRSKQSISQFTLLNGHGPRPMNVIELKSKKYSKSNGVKKVKVGV